MISAIQAVVPGTMKIEQVANGYLVFREQTGDQFVRNQPGEMLVFRTKAELLDFVKDHFTHCSSHVPSD